VGVLGHVHGDLGALQQLIGVAAMLGIEGDADACLHVQSQIIEPERLVEGGLQLASNGHGALDGGNGGEQDGELVAAQPGDSVDLAQAAAQAFADLDQQLIAVVVAKGVVDLLEAVQIQQQQGGRDQFAV
jgi:hypothetical protein